jgi:hypothetical protein
LLEKLAPVFLQEQRAMRKAIFLWLAAAVLLSLVGCGGKVPAPASYKTWKATDGTFVIQYPEGWEAQGGGKQGVQWAEFSYGSARIRIDVSTTSSLIGDIAGSTNTLLGLNEPLSDVDPELMEEMAPVAQAHEFYQKAYPVELSAYKEQEPVAYHAPLGDCRKSEFTARSGAARKLRGYRATAMTRDKGVHILCQCTDANWKTLQPAFDRVLASIAYGGGP